MSLISFSPNTKIKSADMNSNLTGLANGSNWATNAVGKASSVNTNTSFNNSFTTVESVAITLNYTSILVVHGSCDGRRADSNTYSCQAKIVSTTSAVDTDRSEDVFGHVGDQYTGSTRGLLAAMGIFELAAGSHTLKLRCVNGSTADSITVDNSQIVAAWWPKPGG